MDAIELVKVMQRIAKSQGKKTYFVSANCDPAILVEAIKAWGEKNLAKTRQSEFLKTFPNVCLDTGGSIDICPGTLVSEYRTCDNKCIHCGDAVSCLECRKDFWESEIE